MATSTFPLISSLSFLSPRTGVSSAYSNKYAAEDNGFFTAINGTYDKLFPLYALNNIKNENEDTYRPKFLLVNELSTTQEIGGQITPTIFREKQSRREQGASDSPHPILSNPNLQKNIVNYREFYMQKFSPGWTTIQVFGTVASYVVTCPGDTKTAKANIANLLPDKQTSATAEAFNIGSIVNYKDYVWRCIVPTKAFPPANFDVPSTEWVNMPELQTIFTAYIYSFVGNGLAFQDIYEENREFIPAYQDTDLVGWNISCYYI